MKKAAKSLFFTIWVIIRSVFSKDWVIIWVIIITQPRSVFLFWAVVTLTIALLKCHNWFVGVDAILFSSVKYLKSFSRLILGQKLCIQKLLVNTVDIFLQECKVLHVVSIVDTDFCHMSFFPNTPNNVRISDSRIQGKFFKSKECCQNSAGSLVESDFLIILYPPP